MQHYVRMVVSILLGMTGGSTLAWYFGIEFAGYISSLGLPMVATWTTLLMVAVTVVGLIAHISMKALDGLDERQHEREMNRGLAKLASNLRL
jgi:hypothetical protein